MNVDRVTLIVGGLLALFPLHAACYPAPRGDPQRPATTPSGQRYFLDDFGVTYAPAARVLRQDQRDQTPEDGRPAFYGIGNPQPLLPGFVPLPFAHLEVEEIAALFPAGASTTLYEADATRQAVEELLGRGPAPAYLHFACHGLFNLMEPLASGLALAWQNGNHKYASALLTLSDLLNRFSLAGARLVVLSACQTAIVEMQQTPDEAIGLPAGFLQAGAAAVVGSLWPVGEISTALLMERFYHYYLCENAALIFGESLSLAQSLRRAQQWLRELPASEIADRLSTERRKPEHERSIPLQLASRAWRAFAGLQPDHRPFDDPIYWAAFSYTGI